MTNKDKQRITKFEQRLQRDLKKICQDDFIEFLKDSKVSKTKIKLAERINWGHIISVFSRKYEIIYRALDIPREAHIFFNLGYTEGFILFEVIRPLLYKQFYYYLQDKSKMNDYKLYEMMREAVKTVRGFLDLVLDHLDLAKLKREPSVDIMQAKNEELQRKLSKFTDKFPSKKNLTLYGQILKWNDEYKEKYSRSNYRLATKNVTKYYDKKFDNFYKAFDRFKERNKIHTYKEFKNSIYYSIVDKQSPAE